MAEIIQNQPFVEANALVSEGGLAHGTRRRLRFAKTKHGIRLPMVGTHARGASIEISESELRSVLDLLYPKTI